MLCLKPGNVLLSSLPDRYPAHPGCPPSAIVTAALSDFGLSGVVAQAGVAAPRVMKPVFNYM